MVGVDALVRTGPVSLGFMVPPVPPRAWAGRPWSPRQAQGPRLGLGESGMVPPSGSGSGIKSPFLGGSSLQLHWMLPPGNLSQLSGSGPPGRGKAGGDRKASELSQAGGHQGAALEFLHRSWTAPDVAFPDPAGPCLLGINTEEALCRGRGGPWEEEDSQEFGSACVLSAWSLSCRSRGQLRASVSSPTKWVWASRFCPGRPVLASERTEQAAPGPGPGEDSLPRLTSVRWGRLFPTPRLRLLICKMGWLSCKSQEVLSPSAVLLQAEEERRLGLARKEHLVSSICMPGAFGHYLICFLASCCCFNRLPDTLRSLTQHTFITL